MQGVAVTQAGDLGRTGLAQRCQQGASIGVQRPQHYIAPPALDAQAAGKDRHATPRSLAVHVEAVEQHPVGAGHAPDRQRLRHQRAVFQTFFQSIANPAHEPPPRAHGRLACATLARNGMFIIDNPLFPQLRPLPSAAIAAMDVPSQSRGSAWRERISSIRRMLPRCSSPGRKSTLCPPQARCSSSLSSSRTRPWTGARATAGTGADTRYRPTRPHPRPAAPQQAAVSQDQLQQGRETLQTFQGLQVSLHVVEHQRPPHPSASSNSPRASPQNRRRRRTS